MTRPIEDVEIALQLSMLGASKRSIALRIGVSRTPFETGCPIHNGPSPAASTEIRGRSVAQRACRSSARRRGHIPTSWGCTSATAISRAIHDSYRLRIACDQKHRAIMQNVAAAITTVVPATVGRLRSIGCDEVYAYSRHWPCLCMVRGTSTSGRYSLPHGSTASSQLFHVRSYADSSIATAGAARTSRSDTPNWRLSTAPIRATGSPIGRTRFVVEPKS